MKKILLILFATAVLLTGCKRDYEIVDQLPEASGVDDPADINDVIPQEVIEDNILPDDIPPDEPVPVYLPGEYTGEGTGYNGVIVLNVTVDEYYIKGIELVKNSESAGYIPDKTDGFIAEIVANNSLDVDAVAGATKTCDGILSAVMSALEQARE